MRGKLDRKEEQKLTKQKPNLSGYCLYEAADIEKAKENKND
jgi:hypothetical protein